jgi:hypothetical protein
MPQLIAMVIVVVGAMIYMFQTFGGTGDKIEGIAQKTSIVTEINNIKNGLKLAAKAEHIAVTAVATGNGISTDAVKTLQGLGKLAYFPEQVNTQVVAATATNVYNAISFGGIENETTPAMQLSLVATTKGFVPGIYVDLSKGSLKTNAAFLESQIAADLDNVAYIDRHAVSATAVATARGTGTDLEKRTPGNSTAVTTAGSESISDGKFIIYYKDFGSDEVIK